MLVAVVVATGVWAVRDDFGLGRNMEIMVNLMRELSLQYVDEVKADKLMMDTLGEHISAQYIAGKEAECREYRTRVSNWEIAKYMIAY